MNLRPVASKTLLFRPGPATGWLLDGDTLVMSAAMQHLGGTAEDPLARGSGITALEHGALLHGSDTLSGVLLSPDSGPLELAAATLYDRLLDLTEGWHLHRIWNFIPQINAEVDGLENYRAFNSGRLYTLQKRWGTGIARRLPAASALGTRGGALALAFSAAREPATHFDNPLQESSIAYPREYGLSPPAFARGSRLTTATGDVWHLSGTASIRGCRTIGEDIATQLSITMENLAALCAEMAVPSHRRATWKVFLRHPEHLSQAVAAFSAAYPDDMASSLFLHADICRTDLLVEIEGHLSA